MQENNRIENPNIALKLLEQYILISKPFGTSASFYCRMTDGTIMVINKNQKYFITKETFIDEFNLSSFYIYKNLSEVEIDQEFHKLRQ